MKLSLRWYGPHDPVPLPHIRQIPGVVGVVSALHDIAPGEVWPRESIDAMVDDIEQHNLKLTAVESLPVHEGIKLGLSSRDRYIDHYIASLENLASAGITTICYNFMPVFDWMRTDLAYPLADGAASLRYNHADLARIDLSHGTRDLPGWSAAFDAGELERLRHLYMGIHTEMLWDHLAYFLGKVVPVAEGLGIRLGIHPDDPPWPIFDLPRIIVDGDAMRRLIKIMDSPSNGLSLCTGSLGALPSNDLPALVDEFAHLDRIVFMHVRNIHIEGDKSFYETAHPTHCGDLNILDILKALHRNGFKGPLRPDHGRMIWGETGKPGYGLFDRALGAAYINGMWEALENGFTI
ncbi:MAG: mannonate dehydratase [Deltaproteobacteria bacterium]|nr:mannonate dehydratase [Deltaproteobacteria bacterium]